ncbi:MAG: hypothetical protein WDA20_05685 [Desulfuromonadales bacterium]|jgi:hypothetical protein
MNLIFKAFFSKSHRVSSLVFLALIFALIAGCGDDDDDSVSIQTFSMSTEYDGKDQLATLLDSFIFTIDYPDEPTPDFPQINQGIYAIFNEQELANFSQQSSVDVAGLVTFDFTVKDYFIVVDYPIDRRWCGDEVGREARVQNKLFIYEVDYAVREGWACQDSYPDGIDSYPDGTDSYDLKGFIFEVYKP